MIRTRQPQGFSANSRLRFRGIALRHITPSYICLMDDIGKLVSEAITDFSKVTDLVGPDGITPEIMPRPHKSKGLPVGKIAVYAFFLNGKALKVGKVGANSDARYRSQHYNPKSAGSNLARSILKDPAKVGAIGIDERNVGDWIKQHTDRVNLLLPETLGKHRLSLLESFLHDRWKPLFEGRSGND